MKITSSLLCLFIASPAFAGTGQIGSSDSSLSRNFKTGENLVFKSDIKSHHNVSVIAINPDNTVDAVNNDEADNKYRILKGINPSNLSRPIKSIKNVSTGDHMVAYGDHGHMKVIVMAVYADETADIYHPAQNYSFKSVNISTLRKPVSVINGFSVGSVSKMKFSDGLIDDVKILAVYEDKRADVLYLKNGYIYENIDIAFLN